MSPKKKYDEGRDSEHFDVDKIKKKKCFEVSVNRNNIYNL
jgi:hypothetical protein